MTPRFSLPLWRSEPVEANGRTYGIITRVSETRYMVYCTTGEVATVKGYMSARAYALTSKAK